ncbi:hypothetical protein ACJRO7_022992 [Eucalyptus globulus]|uniref:Uncharacterized protein n=1 Tax=Eucalyptus globulus TaxID=34317 RepID=A0ABD3K9R1_EUCGL
MAAITLWESLYTSIPLVKRKTKKRKMLGENGDLTSVSLCDASCKIGTHASAAQREKRRERFREGSFCNMREKSKGTQRENETKREMSSGEAGSRLRGRWRIKSMQWQRESKAHLKPPLLQN